MADFQIRGFGMFVHFGAYIQYNNGEWAMKLRNHNAKEYEQKALALDYSSFNADNLIACAKACGARYITLIMSNKVTVSFPTELEHVLSNLVSHHF
ncbi:MAG: alpha-L-fucosidase [Oscillospiraceae bacterium]